MRSKKGFTLIELLAVIVILAIIALIAVPIILNMINDARKSAAVDSAYGYIEAIEYQNSMNMLDKKHQKIEDGKNIDVTTIDSLVKVKGTRPDSGTLIIEKGRVKEADLCINGFNIIYDGEKAKATDSTKCGKESDEVVEVIIEDKVPCQLEAEIIDNKEYLYIDSVEDMYGFSKSVNNGNTYEGKIVKLRNNLDFSTYKPEEKTSVCEINNDSGFIPIGTEAHPFMGTFDGGVKVINNLTINRPKQSYVGLFGYINSGTIHGLILKNIEVNGSSDVGLFGHVIGTNNEKKANIYGIRILNEQEGENNFKGGFTGVNSVGGIVGYANSYTTIKEIELDNVNVIGTGDRPQNVGGAIGGTKDDNTIIINNIMIKNGKVSGWNYVGYLAGINYHRVKNSVVEKLAFNMTAVGTSSKTSSSYNTYHSNSCTTGGSIESNGYDSKGIDDINFYEAAGLDTWIGGDDDESGYYFDYDDNNKIVLKSIKRYPIKFNLSKDSKGNYLIKNEKDWKVASLKNNGNYKLESDLDFSKNKYYMLGSNQNKFSGTLDGNDKTVKNITINGNRTNFLGMIGFVNSGTIHGITVKNIEVNGYGNVGLIGQVIGTSDEKRSNIYGIRIINKKEGENNFKGGFTGNNVVGSLVGHANSYTTIKEIELDNINVIGNGDRPQNIGGAIGYVTDNDTMSISNILIKNALVSGWNVVGYLSGGGYNRITNSIVEKLAFNMTAVGTLYKTSSSYNTYHSNSCTTGGSIESVGFDSSLIGDLDYYAGKLETLYDGDKNGTGYFFDYVEDSNGIQLVKAYTPQEADTPTEKPNCTIIKGSQERGCYLYTSGVHGNYLYEGVSASDTGAGATCSSTPGRFPAYRYKIKYNCS